MSVEQTGPVNVKVADADVSGCLSCGCLLILLVLGLATVIPFIIALWKWVL